MDRYIPPFKITNEMLIHVSNIMEKVGKIDNYTRFNDMPKLRKNNTIKSVYGTLSIEDKVFNFKKVNNILLNKALIGHQKEIQEVKNAYRAYEMIHKYNYYSLKDLKMAHDEMNFLLSDTAGEFRREDAGVFDEKGRCIDVCPSYELIDSLMKRLFDWIKNSENEIHPLILASVFHYEFLFIHPFKDGNEKMARLWQKVILSNWKNLFEYVPIELIIKNNQDKYYDVINKCNTNGESTQFVEFMLEMIDESLDELLKTDTIPINEVTINVNKLLNVMDFNSPISANEIMSKLGIRSKETLRATYLSPALKDGLVALTIPDKPTSKHQMYYKI